MKQFFGSVIGKAIGVLALIILVAGTTTYCSSSRQAFKQAEQDARSSGATASAFEEAADAARLNSDEDAAIDEIVDDALKLIDEGNIKDEKVSRTIIINSLCRLPDYSDDPACSMPQGNTSAAN